MAPRQIEETTISFPMELKVILRKDTRHVIHQIKLAAAVELFREGYLSLEKAMKLADMPRWEFIRELGNREVSIFRLDKKELKKDIANA